MPTSDTIITNQNHEMVLKKTGALVLQFQGNEEMKKK